MLSICAIITLAFLKCIIARVQKDYKLIKHKTFCVQCIYRSTY